MLYMGTESKKRKRVMIILPDFSFVTREFPDRPDITIRAIADVHLGARECMEKEWENFCSLILNDPNAYITLGGDLINNATRSGVSNIFEETMRPREQKRRMVEMLKPLAKEGRILCGTDGNHERRSQKDSDGSPMYDIMCKLDLEELYRENIAFLRLRFGDNRKSHGSSNPTYVLAVTHGAGGGRLPGAAVNNASRFGQYFDGIDGLIVAHTHRPFDLPECKIKVDSITNTITQRPFMVLSASSWLEYGGYPVQKLLPPTATIPQIMTVHGRRKTLEVTNVYNF